ncbi:MAG: hypothetical protein NTU91_01235 [Chloroflexi bacterium]|nr:hypothetical protein [Chloroflexota bacterium]
MGFAHPLAFRQNQTDGFLRGGQVGWIHTRILMQPRAAAELAFLRNLARVRAQAHAFLVHGSFIGPVEVDGDNPRLTAEVNMPAWMVWVPDLAPFEYRSTARYSIDIPAVQATGWPWTTSTLFCQPRRRPEPLPKDAGVAAPSAPPEAPQTVFSPPR